MAEAGRRVFLSHTGELRAHPSPRSFVAAVEHAVALAGDTAVDMDYFGARDDEPAAFCVRQVRGCDIYLGLIGFRYGTPVPDRPEVSYTELEYEAATAAGIPRLVFLLDEDAEVPIRDFADRVYGDRQDRFRERLKAGGIIAAGFRAPADLETAVLKALVTLREERRLHAADPAPDGPADAVVPVPAAGRRPWLVPARYNRVVARPALTDAVVARLTAAPGGSDRPPVVLHGGGGFGKTTLAVEVCHDPRIAARFPGGILWTTLGEALSGAGLADRINDLCEALSGTRPTLADPEQAGFRLGELLGDEPRLLVVDDAWLRSQVRPFLQGGSATVRLVTTRIRDLLPNADGVAVAAMRVDEARELLVDGLGGDLPAAEVRQLLAMTGRWPVLVKLVNRAIWRYVRDGLPLERASYRVRRRLERRGPTALDVSRPEERQEAVEATLAASLALLTGDRLDRYLELAIFPEDVDIPRRVLNLLWGATGDLDSFEVDELCGELADLSLVLAYRGDPPSLRLQDVLRSYLRGRAGAARLRATNAALLDAAADTLAAPSSTGGPTRPWWTLAPPQAYLWKNLVYHLAEAGRDEELRALARELRWAVSKLARPDLGPVAVEADLGLAQEVSADPVIVALRRAIGQAAHLLTPVEPAAAIGAVLVSRLDGAADVEEPVRRYVATLAGPRLVNRWPLPDRPHPALRRVLRAHNDWVSSCAVAPDGDWIASAAADGFARVWDARTGTPRREWAGPGGELQLWRTGPDELTVAALTSGRVVRWDVETGQVSTVLAVGERFDRCAAAPDGGWLAGVTGEVLRVWRLPRPAAPAGTAVHAEVEVHVAGDVATMGAAPGGEWFATGHCDGTVGVWDPSDGRVILRLPGPSDVWALAAGTDATTLVAGYRDGTLRIFDLPGGRCRQVLVDHDPATTRSGVRSVAVGPNGRWLACGTTNGKIKVWDLATGTRRAAFGGHTARVRACAVTADGTLVTGGGDDTVRIWAVDAVDASDSPPSPAERVGACAVSPDGTWFATGARDARISLWDPRAPGAPAPLRTFGPVRGWVDGLAVAPRGDWIASTHWDPAVHIWDVRGGGPLVTLDAGAESVRTCAAAPDGSWLATGGSDGRVLLWDMPAGTRRSVVTQESGTIFSCVAGPDGSWLAAGGAEGALRIWDTASGIRRREFAAPAAHHVRAAAAAPDGSWVASGHGDGTARIWDLASGRLRALVRANDRCVFGCAASPDSSLLATCGEDGTLRIFDARTGACVTVMRVDGILLGCAWLTDGTGLVAVGAGSIYLFTLVP